jgi:hypothetical protein
MNPCNTVVVNYNTIKHVKLFLIFPCPRTWIGLKLSAQSGKWRGANSDTILPGVGEMAPVEVAIICAANSSHGCRRRKIYGFGIVSSRIRSVVLG